MNDEFTGWLAEADQKMAVMRETADRLVVHLGELLDECDGNMLTAYMAEYPSASAAAAKAGTSAVPLALWLGLLLAETKRKEVRAV